MGTNDVDMLVAFHVEGEDRHDDPNEGNDGDQRERDDRDDEPDLGPLEAALSAADFNRDPKIEGWRWITRVQGHVVKVEFL